MNAIIIGVGDELTSGQTIDTNGAYLARKLTEKGISVAAHYTVGDSLAEIAEAIARAAQHAQFVLVSGGLGPTEDDLTRQALAKALGRELALDEPSLARIEEFFRRRGRTMAAVNRIQAMIPAGCEVLANTQGTAPGIAAKLGQTEIFLLPGVPHEMRQMFRHQIAPRLKGTADVILQRVVHTFGLGESDLSEKLTDLTDRRANPTVGITAAAGLVSIRITARAKNIIDARKQADEVAGQITSRLGSSIIGTDDQTMAGVVGDLLRRRQATLAVAESCTGGMVGKMITEAAGSSEYFLGGVIAYADEVKQELLDVPQELQAAHGAVSEQAARAMAEGGRKRLASDYCLSITGIAGPAGGSEAKPVGLVYIALACPDGTWVYKHVFPGDRQAVRRRSTLAALNYLRLKLLAEMEK